MRRRLSREESALWARVAQSVTPLPGTASTPKAEVTAIAIKPPEARQPAESRPASLPASPPPTSVPRRLDHHGLDAGWDRKLAQGMVAPDFTLDLHGANLDSAYVRLEHGITLAAAQGARVILLITGRARPGDGHADRGERRGAIRAKFMDWLAAGSHAGKIAAIRPAHPRHGGSGAVYVVLRRRR